MSFQGSINNLLHTVAVAKRLDPAVEAKAEANARMAQLNLKAESLEKAHNIEKARGPMPIDRQVERSAERLDIAKEQYDLEPTVERKETLDEYQRQHEKLEEVKTERDLTARHRRATAEAKIRLALEQKRVGETMLANAPQSFGKKETIKYDNI